MIYAGDPAEDSSVTKLQLSLKALPERSTALERMCNSSFLLLRKQRMPRTRLSSSGRSTASADWLYCTIDTSLGINNFVDRSRLRSCCECLEVISAGACLLSGLTVASASLGGGVGDVQTNDCRVLARSNTVLNFTS
ncbi:hypothetical protein Pst134EB_012866 [Puccinia striiformis f. sp. tritici]|nr:hypothetical protein Pst134EB_012866 [Puccinia striiformis f. sp. tritici]